MDWAADGAEGGSSFGVVAVNDGRLDRAWRWERHIATTRVKPGCSRCGSHPTRGHAGIGRALVEHVVDWARSRAFPVLRLRVTQTNAGAMRLYERCGFTDEGVRLPLREGSGVMTTSMTMDLSA